MGEKKVLRFGNRSMGMIRGHHEERRDRLWRALKRRLMRISPYEELHRYVLHQFEGVDHTVFGHSHRPYMKVRTGILLPNPGALAPTPGLRHSVGTLDVGEMTTTGKIIYSRYF